jgi:Mg/Co/Ni transporter MgtE
LLSYDEDTAGGIMTPHFISCRENITVGEAIEKIIANQKHEIADGIVVLDSRGILVDHVQLVELLSAKPGQKVGELVGPPYPVAVHYKDDIEKVVEEFSKNRGASIVVVDDRQKAIGRILADDLVDNLAKEREARGLAQGSGALS